MPLAAVIGGRVFCVHGGLSPELQTLDSIASVSRPVDPAGDRVICDILWSDPDRVGAVGCRYFSTTVKHTRTILLA